MSDPIDILMWVGEEHYTVDSFIEEAQRMGVSKRISKSAIPEGIVPGVSRLLIKHRRAIVHGEVKDLVENLAITRAAPEYDLVNDMLQIVRMLERIKEREPDFYKELVETYNLTWTPGVIGYTYITSIQYVAHDHEEGLPKDLAHLEGYVEPVRIEYGFDLYDDAS